MTRASQASSIGKPERRGTLTIAWRALGAPLVPLVIAALVSGHYAIEITASGTENKGFEAGTFASAPRSTTTVTWLPVKAAGGGTPPRANSWNAPAAAGGPIWRSAVAQLPVRAARSTQGGRTTGSGGVSGSTIAILFGAGLLATGLVMTAYGESDGCYVKYPDGGACNAYARSGFGIGVGGLVALIAGGLAAGRSGSGSNQPVASPQPVQTPLQVAPASLDPAVDQAARTAIDEIRGGAHTAMPAAQVAGRNSGGATTWTFRNDTAYTLYVYLAGPAGFTLTIPPGASRDASLQAGRYEIGARVSAANILPFYGVRDYERGYAYSDCFYITTGCLAR